MGTKPLFSGDNRDRKTELGNEGQGHTQTKPVWWDHCVGPELDNEGQSHTQTKPVWWDYCVGPELDSDGRDHTLTKPWL